MLILVIYGSKRRIRHYLAIACQDLDPAVSWFDKKIGSGSGQNSNWKQDPILFQSDLNLKINPGSGSAYF